MRPEVQVWPLVMVGMAIWLAIAAVTGARETPEAASALAALSLASAATCALSLVVDVLEALSE